MFVQKLCLLLFHFPKINEKWKEYERGGGGGLVNFSKINKRGGGNYSVLESIRNNGKRNIKFLI